MTERDIKERSDDASGESKVILLRRWRRSEPGDEGEEDLRDCLGEEAVPVGIWKDDDGRKSDFDGRGEITCNPVRHRARVPDVRIDSPPASPSLHNTGWWTPEEVVHRPASQSKRHNSPHSKQRLPATRQNWTTASALTPLGSIALASIDPTTSGSSRARRRMLAMSSGRDVFPRGTLSSSISLGTA